MAATVARRPQPPNGGFNNDKAPFNNGDHDSDDNYGLPSHLTVDNTLIKELARHFIMTHLRNNGCGAVANRLPHVRNPDDETHHIVQAIAHQFEQERSKQFRDILAGLRVDESNLKLTYNTVVSELFRDGIVWGRIVAFLVFSGHMAVYCAQHSMEDRVEDIVEWSELEMQTRVHDWVRERGGWPALVEHFDREPWSVSLSSAIFATGMVLTVIAGGLFAIKQFFS